MSEIDKVQKLIKKGQEVLATHKPSPPGYIGFSTLDPKAFSAWQTQCLNFLETKLSSGSPYVRSFRDKVTKGYQSTVEAGIGILTSVKEDLEAEGLIHPEVKEYDSIECISRICERFHLVARQLRSRHDERDTLDINDEYDVQDLFHSLLHLFFEDIRSEEWTPSYAGQCSRIDFVLKQEQIVIEIKKTRKGLGAKEVGTQLIEDIARYQAHPSCNTLICFVYDPDGKIANPRGIENDLLHSQEGLLVKVFIRP